jgi:hypothetical protein
MGRFTAAERQEGRDKRMIPRVGRKAAALVSTCVGVLVLGGMGCTYPGDTSGFKAEKQQSKADIQKQIDDLKANPKVPEGAKQMGMKKLEKDLEAAK